MVTINIFRISPHFGFMILSKTWFAEVTTLSQELVFARIAEINRGGIFSKFLSDAGCDNLPKSPEKHFLKKCGLRPFVSSQSLFLLLFTFRTAN